MEQRAASNSQTAIVTGGSRGLGRGIVAALATRNMRVVALAKDAGRLAVTVKELGVESVVADVADPNTSARLLRDLTPDLVVLCAGALPVLRPIQELTWETFSLNWEVDTKATFNWIRDALLLPLKRGSHIVVISSIASILGSPLSGSYAGAKGMQRLITEYAVEESARLKLDIRFHCLLPTLNPNTDLGRATMVAYSRRAGLTIEQFAKRFDPPLTPDIIGRVVIDLHESPERWNKTSYRVSGDGLVPLDEVVRVQQAAASIKSR